MRFNGTLKFWNDERGFGFIEPFQGGQEIFVHIKAFPAGTGRPSVGQYITFKVETVENGKKRAHSVQYPVRVRRLRVARTSRVESPATWTPPRVLVIPLFVAIYLYVAWHWGFRPFVLIAYLGISFVAFMAYAFDKSAAIAKRQRTPERILHLLAIIGGWPGALLAQQLLRHKTSKETFIATFWGTVVLNIAALVACHVYIFPVVGRHA